VVCQPNDWARLVQDAAKDIEASRFTERDLLLRDYWTALRQVLEDSRSRVRTQKPLPQSWTNAALGRSGVFLVAVARVKKRTMSVQVTLQGPNRHQFFEQFESDKQVIETQLGFVPEWLKMEEKQESQIKLSRDDVDLADKSKWPEYLQWMQEKLERLHSVFSVRARNLSKAEEDDQ
jgi:hypothetical protein